jgi:GAF domain-containing protein
LCSDLARLGEPGELPSLLARAAEVLDARVLILWVGDAKGVELRPVLSHGYPAQALSRLAATPREADNATAAAWRHAALQVVPSSDVAAGALVVPLLTPEGCLGVLAAETRHGTERREPVQALARILAAQLSTLIGVPAAPAEAAPLESTSSAG